MIKKYLKISNKSILLFVKNLHSALNFVINKMNSLGSTNYNIKFLSNIGGNPPLRAKIVH